MYKRQLSDHGVDCEIWSVTSYGELRRAAAEIERWNRLHPSETARSSWVSEHLDGSIGTTLAVSDNMMAVPDLIRQWVGGDYVVLGTDGFGLSESRDSLRNYFEVSKDWIVFTALSTLARANRGLVDDAITYADENELDRDRLAPF